jgi:4-diphosphocytidyl-2-C-methyl-D-erythritol kinase
LSECPEILCKGISISIKKNIPSEAGLGGGSADAAAVLCALNEMFGYPIAFERLLEIGGDIGADVPFCMVGGTAFATGKGTHIAPISDMPDCFIVIAKGSQGVSTPWAFGELDRIYENFSQRVYAPYDVSVLKKSIDMGDLTSVGGALYNIFEKAVFSVCSEPLEIKNTMLEFGSCGAIMSGSGAAVFGLFESEDKANEACRALASKGYFSYTAQLVSKL